MKKKKLTTHNDNVRCVRTISKMRPDISDKLVHFTSGDSWEEAFERLKKIIGEGRLEGHARLIKGEFQCVCFSEAPLVNLTDGLVNSQAYSRYSPFGVMFDKSWIFSLGGRPVIYQTDEEFLKLPEEIGWRHVRYDPNHDPPIDFTWEREWRIHCSGLDFNPSVASVVVPDYEWAAQLFDEHETEEDYKIRQYQLIFDEIIAEMYREPFHWTIWTLR